MTKPKWTKGPWRVEELHYSTSIYAGHDETIAEVLKRTAASGNARLIAQAPEMADFLRRFISLTEVTSVDEARIILAKIEKGEGNGQN